MNDSAMNKDAVSSVHWRFWVIGGLAMVWNTMGVINFFVQMNADSLAKYPEAYHPIIEGRPAWATVAFAVAVCGGVLGCLLLLLRKAASHFVFIASLVGVAVTMIHVFRVAGFSSLEIWIGVLMQLVVAAFLTWYSKYAEHKRWLR